MGKIHEIKIYEDFADAIVAGDKNFEIRLNDRGYQKGDIVKFNPISRKGYSYGMSEHPLNDKEYEITYVMSGFGLKENYCVFGIKKISKDE